MPDYENNTAPIAAPTANRSSPMAVADTARQWLVTNFPARPNPGETFSRRELAMFALVALAILYWVNLVSTNLPKYWAMDFRYFWTAGRIWLDGGYVYSPSYMALGESAFGAFADPFYYPPALAPLMAPLTALPPLAAARVFVGVNLLALLLASRLLAKLTVELGIAENDKTATAAFSLFYLAMMMPTIAIAAYGHIGILLGVAVVSLAYGWVCKKPFVSGAAMTLLLVKPHIGLAVIILASFFKDQRLSVFYALVATAILSVVGLHFHNPIAALSDYLSHLSYYGERAGNAGAYSAGLGFLLFLTGASLTPVITVATALITPLASGLLFARRSTTPIAQVGVIMLTLSLVVFLTPNHRTDFILLAPAVLFVVAPIGLRAKAVLFGGFIILGQSVRLIMGAENHFGVDSEILTSLLNTSALALIIATLATFLRRQATSN